jgi:membrane-bound inhibitor of C-type lysozyme
MFSSKKSKVIAAGIAAIVIAGGSYGIVSATSGSTTTTTTASSGGSGSGHALPGGSGSEGSASNARSGPAEGGTVGTVGSVSTSGFTLSTSAGQKVTVKEASSTTYEQGTSPASAGAVTTGAPVLVLGTTDSTTITATQVIVAPPSSGASSPGGQVIAYSKGKQGSAEQVGQIPADYTQGSGTLASGTTADKATEAALTAYPGGIVDRVVELGSGDYEVHYIGVNWPHHIFVNQDFQVIGANS